MKLFFFVAFVVLVGFLIYRVATGFSHSSGGKASGGLFGSFSKAAGAEIPRKAGKVEPAYDVFPEHLRSQVGPFEIVTDGGEYCVNRMSVHGLVTQIADRVVRVTQPDGRIGFVLADDKSVVPDDDSQGQPQGESSRPQMVAARKRPKEENPIQEAVEADRPSTPRPRATRPLGMRPQRDDVAPLPETGSSFYTPSSPAQMQQAAQHVMNARAGVDDSGSPLRPSY